MRPMVFIVMSGSLPQLAAMKNVGVVDGKRAHVQQKDLALDYDLFGCICPAWNFKTWESENQCFY